MDKIQKIKVKDLFSYPDNPFQVRDDEELTALTESVRDFGVINPLVVRQRKDGGYEIVSGHRRTAACKKAGIEEVPAFVCELDDDAAAIALVDSNLQREHIRPSERAFAYKMKLEAIKHQGKTSVQVAPKLSTEVIGEQQGISKDQVKRYIRLTNLIPELLQMVDDGKISLTPAVELSYLDEKEQRSLLESMQKQEATPSLSQAQRIRQMETGGGLNADNLDTLLREEKGNQKEQVRLQADRIRKYFPKEYTIKQMESTIVRLLADWQRRRQHSSREER